MDRVIKIGLVVFSVVIVFSIIVEIDTIKRDRDNPEYVTEAVSEIGQRLDSPDQRERRTYLNSLIGKYISLTGVVREIGIVNVTLEAPGGGRVIKVNVTRSVRRKLIRGETSCLEGRIRRISSNADRIIFELADVRLVDQ